MARYSYRFISLCALAIFGLLILVPRSQIAPKENNQIRKKISHVNIENEKNGKERAPHTVSSRPAHSDGYYDCRERLDKSSAANGTSEWSLDTWQREYCQRLERETWQPANLASDHNLLFVDGREECERYREFIIKVRQSTFRGHIVLLVYYPEDRDRCGRLAKDLSVEIHFHDSPRWEWTLFMYHGVASYFESNPKALSKYSAAAMVRPDHIVWCSNPFDDIAAFNESVYAIYFKDPRSNAVLESYHNSKPGAEVINDHFLFSTPTGLNAIVRVVLGAVSRQLQGTMRRGADPSWSYLRSDPDAQRYATEVVRKYRFVEKDTCVLGETICSATTKGVTLGNFYCYKADNSGNPLYSPYCYLEHRYPVWEVPPSVSLASVATPKIMSAVKTLKEACGKGGVNDVFSNPSASDTDRDASPECPNGKLAVLTMMGGYTMDRVKEYIGSFLFYADPKCTKLVLLLKERTGIHKVAEMYPGRVEVVFYTEEFIPKTWIKRGIIDQRHEVVLNWLEKNYKGFRYIMANDSKDIVYLSDPLKQLIATLSEGGFLNTEFAGSVVESFGSGSFSWSDEGINMAQKKWMRTCGDCFAYMAGRSYVSVRQPYAVINSGHLVGSTLGMLHYLRFHVRMTVLSEYDFSASDQGPFNFYMQGIAQQANYPHKVLLFSPSRSGFANPAPIHRMARRNRTSLSKEKGQQYEYTLIDCNRNIVSAPHQANRARFVESALQSNLNGLKAWAALQESGEFNAYFMIPKEKKKK